MRAAEFWRIVVADDAGLLEKLLHLFRSHDIPFCVIGGQAVDAYVEPLVSLDLDIVIATDQIDKAVAALTGTFEVQWFPHTISVAAPASDLRIRLQTDPRYGTFVEGATVRDVLGTPMPVTDLSDLLLSKVWAALGCRSPRQQAPERSRRHCPHARSLSRSPRPGA